MGAYVIEVRRPSLGSGPDEVETVCALGESQKEVLALVQTALQLTDEDMRIVRGLSAEEAHKLGLKPFQVKHLK